MDDNGGSDTIVIYHGSCTDGFAAAWVAHKVLPDAKFFPAIHGQKPPDVKGKKVYLFDFAYKREAMLRMKDEAKSLIVLDHHKTAAEELKDLDFCHFDMTKSGASLAWHFFKDRIKGEMPWLISYTEDRDLGLWQLPFSHEIAAAVNSYPFDFKVWDALERVYPTNDIVNSSLVHDGHAIMRFQQRLVEIAMHHAVVVMLDNYRIMAANTSLVHGEVASKLAETNPFGLSWYKREDGKIVHSLRSKSDGVDVSAIAYKHGGGGHPHAAGFESIDMVIKEV